MTKITLIIVAASTFSCASSTRELETHMALLDTHLDRLSASIDALNVKIGNGTRTPAVAGVTCRDGKLTDYAQGELRPGEKALGRLEPCPAPKNYAQCLSGLPASDVAGACSAGKLDELLAKKP
jgi:hypothetical protein